MIVEKLGGEVIFRNHTNFGKPLAKPSVKRKNSCEASVYSKEEGKTAIMKQDIIDRQVENFSSREAVGALDRLRSSRSLDNDSWKDCSSDAESQGLSVIVKFPLVDVSDMDSLGDDGLDLRDERSKSLVSFGNLENDYFQQPRVMGKSVYIQSSKQDADRVAKLAFDSNRSRCHFVRCSNSDSVSSFSSSENEEMNASLEEVDGPTTYFSHYINLQISPQIPLPHSEMDPMRRRI